MEAKNAIILVGMAIAIVGCIVILGGDDSDAFTTDGITYEVNGKGTVKVTEVSSLSETVNIPTTVTNIVSGETYTVTEIENLERPDGVNTTMTTLNIPSTITAIDSDAFYDLNEVNEYNVDPDNETFRSVDGVIFNKDMTTLMFYPKSKITENYTVPYGVTTIGPRSFWNAHINSITFPDTVDAIGYSAFQSAWIESIDVGNNLRTIGTGDFAYSNLKTLHIPASNTYLYHPFGLYAAIERITVDPANPNYASDANGFLYNKDMTELIYCPASITGTITIPSHVRTITNGALNGSDATEIIISEGITTLESDSISTWKVLQISFPSTLTSVAYDAIEVTLLDENGAQFTINASNLAGKTFAGSDRVLYEGRSYHTLTFNANGGDSEAPESITALSGSTVTLPEYEGSRDGYDFRGWYVNGNTYEPGTEITIGDADLELAALWVHHSDNTDDNTMMMAIIVLVIIVIILVIAVAYMHSHRNN